jgi:hypothetical protein
VKLAGSLVIGDSPINASGGSGAGDGRFILASNYADSYAGPVTGARIEKFPGTRRDNPFVKGAGYQTPAIPNTVMGAEAFGLAPATANPGFYDEIRGNAPANAVMAIAMNDGLSPGVNDGLAGFDLLSIVNLRDQSLTNPQLGVDLSGSDHSYLVDLIVGGYQNDPLFGGTGPKGITSLPAFGVYTISVPEAANSIINVKTQEAEMHGVQLSLGAVIYVVSPSQPAGDFNHDGAVDTADYVLWRNTLNQSVPIGSGADGNFDGQITVADYDVWRSHFGATTAATSAPLNLSVPEPATTWTSAVLLLFALLSRRGLVSRYLRS